MKIFIKSILCLTVVCLALWLLPWMYKYVTATPKSSPFTLYSCVSKSFVSYVFDDGGNRQVVDSKGNVYPEYAMDSLLPLYFYRQLMADGKMPDSLCGEPVTPRLIQTEQLNFRLSPVDVNWTAMPLYLLLESESGRVDLEMPEDVFRFVGNRIEFVDMAGNEVNQAKSQLFTDVFVRKEFAFPASIVTGNATNRKEYDEGYLLTDAAGRLFHFKQIKGRPYLRAIQLPDSVEVCYAMVTEFRNRRQLGFLFDTQKRVWALHAADYSLHKLELPPFNPRTMSMAIVGNLFDWTVAVRNADAERMYALDAADYSLIDSTSNRYDETTASRVARWIFPLQLNFSSNIDEEIRPRFDL